MARRGEILRVFAFFLLIPFLCSALILPGTMPARDAQGRVTVILCGDDLPVQMTVSADGDLIPLVSEDGPAKQPCIWSSHAQPLLTSDALPVQMPRLAGWLDLQPQPVVLPVSRQVDIRPARGPPATA